MTRLAKILVVCCLAAQLALSSLAAELLSSFEEAAARGDVLEKAPKTKDYFSKTLMPYFGKKYATVLQFCFANVSNPDNSPFSLVAAIGADGRTVRIYNDHATNISHCMNNSLSGEIFPAPPVAPYYFHIAMKFADDPAPKSDVSESAPPLVLESNKYSYTFGVPKGWEFNFDKANDAGVRLLYFPKGGNFNDSNSIVYVNEDDDLCKATCAGMLGGTISKTIEESRSDSPMLQVAKADSIPLKGGGTATVRILSGWRDPRQAKEALAFIEHQETIVLVVLTVKSVKTWEQDYAAFQEIVANHKFFNCDSPGLAASCQ
ncbi:MAG TPA: hypothetical protein VKH15_05970 [Candidatus Acidoferrum sp.]|nr:hypothetical protein [Candidatus Acidoferrum sp.]